MKQKPRTRDGLSREDARHGITAASAAYLNEGVELTASSVRCAPASGSGSGLAFGCINRVILRTTELVQTKDLSIRQSVIAHIAVVHVHILDSQRSLHMGRRSLW
jgi:hypothetical protein